VVAQCALPPASETQRFQHRDNKITTGSFMEESTKAFLSMMNTIYGASSLPVEVEQKYGNLESTQLIN
jgi:hypothetical protein